MVVNLFKERDAVVRPNCILKAGNYFPTSLNLQMISYFTFYLWRGNYNCLSYFLIVGFNYTFPFVSVFLLSFSPPYLRVYNGKPVHSLSRIDVFSSALCIIDALVLAL